MKSPPTYTSLVAAVAALIGLAPALVAQEKPGIEPEALEILENAFTFYQSNPIEFTSKNRIVQKIGPQTNDMEVTQKVAARAGDFSVVGTSPAAPSPAVYYSNGTATVIFAQMQSYIQSSGYKSFQDAYQSEALGYDPSLKSNAVLSTTPATDFFEKFYMNDAKGRKDLLVSLKIDGEKAVAGLAGHRLTGVVRTNPVGLPVRDASVPFELVVSKGEQPMLLSYAPDNSKLIADFVKNRPQLGSLGVTMEGTFTNWKTGAEVDTKQFQQPDLTSYYKFASFQQFLNIIEGGNPLELEGKPAPDFELPTLGGEKFKLSAEKGKNVVILDFWATWCGPCAQAMPVIESVAKAYEKKGVKLVAVNLEDTDVDVQRFLQQVRVNPIVALDKKGITRMDYMAFKIPMTVVVGKDGVVAKVFVGIGPGFDRTLQSLLNALVAK